MRICSLLPSATEIVYVLGLGDQLVAVTHECDYPEDAKTKPVVTRSAFDPSRHTSAQIEALVNLHLHDHRAIYHLDRPILERLNPDLILTQELCEVCAVSYQEVQATARALYGKRQILSLEPRVLGDVLDQILMVGAATGRAEIGAIVVRQLKDRIDRVKALAATVSNQPRVFCLEWMDPPWVGGHWVPEMVHLAGGYDRLGALGEPSRRVTWGEILSYQPEVVVVMPCGFELKRLIQDYPSMTFPETWQDVPAVQRREVYGVNASAYFSRPGPRLADGLEILGEILHPELFGRGREGIDYARLTR